MKALSREEEREFQKEFLEKNKMPEDIWKETRRNLFIAAICGSVSLIISIMTVLVYALIKIR